SLFKNTKGSQSTQSQKLIEASTLRSIVTTKVLPAAYEFPVRNLQVEIALLEDNIAKVSAIRNAKDAARAAQDELLPVMEDVR
ncbi:3438_t:CDS:2, partial [Paraglomus occultum]